MAFLVWRFLLDPLSPIVARPGRDGLARANEYLRRCGHPPVSALPLPVEEGVPLTSLFKSGMARDTLTLVAMYFVYMIPQFYLQTWLPTLVADIGLSPSHGALVSTCLAIGGVTAGLVVAVTSQRVGVKRLEIMFMSTGTASMVLFSMLPANFPILIAGAALTGFFVQGGMTGLYVIIVRVFPAHLLASGTGFVIGIGRLGSILPPLLAGLLFTAGVGRLGVTLVMAAPGLIALALLLTLRIRPPTTA